GNAEATCPIVAATANEYRQTSGQPRPTATPPAPQKPRWKVVMPPARMQMIDSEMAKLENPLMRRSNSWAYHRLCRVFTSSAIWRAASARFSMDYRLGQRW